MKQGNIDIENYALCSNDELITELLYYSNKINEMIEKGENKMLPLFFGILTEAKSEIIQVLRDRNPQF